MSSENAEITLTVTELEWLLDLVDETVKSNSRIFSNTHPLRSVDSKLHDAYETTSVWADQ